MHPVERMRSVDRAFLNRTSCVYVEPVKRTTYVVPKCNGKCFWAPTVGYRSSAQSTLFEVDCQSCIFQELEDLPQVLKAFCPGCTEDTNVVHVCDGKLSHWR